MKNIYIIAKVIGVHTSVYLKNHFDAKVKLTKQGHEVLFPFETMHNIGMSSFQNDIVQYIKFLKSADMVYVMREAQFCEAAQVEIAIAKLHNIEIHYELENVESDESVDNLHRQE